MDFSLYSTVFSGGFSIPGVVCGRHNLIILFDFTINVGVNMVSVILLQAYAG